MFSRFLTSSALSSKGLATIMIPESLSQSLREYSEHLIPKNSIPRRDLSSSDIAKMQPSFHQIVSKHPAFLNQIQNTLNNESRVINIKGLNFPDISKNDIPQSRRCDDFQESMVGNRDMAICKISTALVMGLLVDLQYKQSVFKLIYPTVEGQGNNDRFDGDKDLLYHNDGWRGGVHDLVILAGVKGHEAVKTKVVLTQQIIDYFKKMEKSRNWKF